MTTRSVLYTILSVPLLLLLGCRDDGLGLPTDASPRVPPVPLAQAEPEPGIVPDLTGTWNGLLGLPAAIVPMQPDEDEEELSFSELDIVDQRDRRVFGTKTMGGTTFDLDGTVSGAGIVSIVFKGVGTSPGTAEGLYHLIAVPELSTTHEGSVREDFPQGVVDNSAPMKGSPSESHGRKTNTHRFRYERASPLHDERLESFERKRCASVPNERSRW